MIDIGAVVRDDADSVLVAISKHDHGSYCPEMEDQEVDSRSKFLKMLQAAASRPCHPPSMERLQELVASENVHMPDHPSYAELIRKTISVNVDDKLKEAIEVLKEEGGSNEGTKRKASRRESFEGELGRRGGAGSGRQEGRPPKIDKTEKMVVYGPKNPRGRPSQPKSEVAQPSGG
ncbi:hypothetical protein ACOSP7_025848 [Xanthoceras sorbifolium]